MGAPESLTRPYRGWKPLLQFFPLPQFFSKAAETMTKAGIRNHTRHSRMLLAGIQSRATVGLQCVAGFPPEACGND
jgi:hypothetical protein